MSDLFDLLDGLRGGSKQDKEDSPSNSHGVPAISQPVTITSNPNMRFTCGECKKDTPFVLRSRRYTGVCILCCFLEDKYDYK